MWNHTGAFVYEVRRYYIAVYLFVDYYYDINGDATLLPRIVAFICTLVISLIHVDTIEWGDIRRQ